MLNGGVFSKTMSINPSELQETLSQQLALALQENTLLKTQVQSLVQEIEAAEEIIVRLQAKDLTWESPNDGLAHHLNHQ